ncbi:basement membrane-specific heparan sulfate proteoglycan core protein isoform X8 [Pieris rapae]|uniref:basement membrane-specific heparan sulfate proteoglycan core protein isoform X8 n=1 Tax=Pieris rapae TaxID=64459 RepID=UPI001E27FF66|nr:basement membrane-specific heparan sulfate proteoglycan core protein isoform X8 [Pieris rapae]
MRVRPLSTALLLVLITLLTEVSKAEDIYWEGENEASNEFLEVDSGDLGIGKHLERLKRQLNFFSFFTTTTPPPAEANESVTEDDEDIGNKYEDVENEVDGGSGVPDRTEPEPKEKTLRVTFVVREPYQTNYSNRDSLEFQNFSKSLAEAVNAVFRDLPGTHRASLIRIQSRATDEFSCKVTIEIVTTGYEDTEKIGLILQSYIQKKMKLGDVVVSDEDFSAIVIDPEDNNQEQNPYDPENPDDNKNDDQSRQERPDDDYPNPEVNENTPGPYNENDREDELISAYDKPRDENNDVNIYDNTNANEIDDDNLIIHEEKNEAGESTNGDRGDTPDLQPTDTATDYPGLDETLETCPDNAMRCDETRCVPNVKRCDQYRDCNDGADEEGCPDESCGVDYFRCNNGKCVEGYRRCDRVVDCPDGEDEVACDCRPDEFQCQDDGSCIESRKRCDGINHCRDGSDENQCTAKGYFRCRGGKLIPENARCNRRYDCDSGDYSDEQNCPCGDEDFKCDNGYCIPKSKQCDRTHDCQDGSDERHCTYGSVCMAYQYKCSSGQCIKAEARCNGTVECDDGSDESNCPCKRGQFQCRDGSCINIAQRCNGHRDCRPSGEDENNCDVERCSPESFTCDRGSSVPCATRCDNNPECDNGEDEDGCPDCAHKCDGRCIEESLICDGVSDCSDSSDEIDCNTCDGPNDFRCRNGECIKASQRCNTIEECSDASDELQCNDTMTTGPITCNEDQFQCRNGFCIDMQFFCDRNPDCTDNSDEVNCPCDDGYWQCRTGQCIRDSEHCDGTYHCSDGSDEYDCPTTYRPFTTAYPYTQPPPTQPPRYFTTTGAPFLNPYVPDNRVGECKRHQWRCENGPCINKNQRCDGHVDCPKDASDEFDCPAGSAIALNLKTYPEEQTVRNVHYGGDVVFSCRDEGPIRAPVRWVREGGRSLKPGSVDRNGRLEMNHVTMGDSGIYMCQAPKYLGSPGSEVRVTLVVESPSATFRPPFITCQYDEATCGNGQCIPKTAVCDRKIDCDDGSDEDTCGQNGLCQPNEYQCANHKCVLKTWFCDSDDDCGDGSDEINCPTLDPHQNCSRVEYACTSNDQCIPRSFHCDGQSDCLDKSDETGCAPVHVTRPPAPTNVRLNPGDTLTLVCEAVGVPTPLISWRLNWGHVPQKCTSTSENGIGRLTCSNMQPEDSGAYSCEAINNSGTVFAIPDAIVYVNRTEALCPAGYFNSEARSQNECIRCFCFGESTTCKSADLFTYNMPTPLGEGGTRLIGVKQSYNGDVQIDKQQTINNQYYYQPLRNGATVTKLADYSPAWSRTSGSHPYLTLPESYNGNQLTSYGGHIKYRLSPHNPQPYGYNDNVPDVVIIGKYQSLVHQSRGDRGRDLVVDARLTPDNWMKPSPRGLIAVTREDIMMALDDIEMILVRADLNNAGVNITDFTMESAQHINVGLGSASLVEECSCPPGYEGLSCQKCASGFARERNGPWLGSCVPKRACPPGTYGDPNSGGDCRPCPCPLTNRENQFARTCSLGPSGIVICDCNPGYEGNDCSRCASNYFGNPLIPGDSCKPRPSDNCNGLGTAQVRLPDECVCKDNVQGRYCDQCKAGTFFLSNDFRDGCASCFCSGVSQECMSSNLRRKTTMVRFNVPQIVGQVKLYKSAPFGSGGIVRYNAPIETDAQPELFRGEMSLSSFDRTQPSIYYWSLPPSFAGDKVTSYGGFLNYELRHVPTPGSQGARNNAADVQLISDNSLTFNYFGSFAPNGDGYLNASLQLLEKGWQRPDGKEVSREHFLLALADVKTILIKATYTTNTEVASVVSASIETAESGGDGPLAQHVEQCVCPGGYMGTSCEDCAPGYTRISSGLYLEHCGPCECNGHSSMCHPETGVCYDCADNTAGANCEDCKEGYQRDLQGNCVPRSSSTPAPCNCDPRGEEIPCDGSGYCMCKQNVEGDTCGRCRVGTFGLDAANPLGCLSCYCSGVTNNCHEANHYARIPIAAPIFGENYGGYTLTDLNGQLVMNDQFVPAPDESELMYMFSSTPQEELYWSLPVFPGNRVLSYGGTLSLTQKFQTGGYPEESVPGNDIIFIGDEISVYWSNPTPIRSGESLSYQVPLQESGWFILNTATPASRRDFMSVLKNLRRVLVRATLSDELLSTAIADVSMDTASELSDSTSPVAKSVEICICPEGYSGTSCETCNAGYYKDQNGRCRQCNCNGHDCQLNSYDELICNCRPPYIGPDCSTVGGENSDDQTTRPVPPQSTVTVTITSPTIKIEEVGSTVNFTCMAQSVNVRGPLIVNWYKSDGELPQDRTQFDQDSGMLRITNLQVSDSGRYICQTSDGVSTNQAFATLKVPGNDMRLPTVSISPPIAEYYEGDRIELTCTTTGNPAPRITWQRAYNRPLPRTTQRYDALLVIENARQDDSGEYRCIASNAAGTRDRTAVVTIRQRPSQPSYQELTVSTQTPTVDEGRSITVVCTGTTNVPAGAINWVRQDGTDFLPNVRSDNGVLYIDYARLENSGVYICQTSAFGVNPTLITLEVRPQGPPVETSNITLSVDHLRIPTGGSGTIDCTPQGYPVPLIKWTKHQDSFGPGTSQRENTLIISNAQDSDQGYYLCEGSVDGVPIISTYVYVEIEKREAPRLEIYPQGENYVTLGTQYQIHCRVTGGIPSPVITWDKNRGQLSPHVEIQQNNNVLSFQTVEVNDEGTYTCTATNEAGSTSASATVKVRSPPEITITPSNFIQVIKGDKVDVECRADGYPEPIVSIKLSDRESVSPSPRIAVLSISYVNERHEGVYTCIATSAAGTVEEQFAIRVERGDGGFGNDVEGSGEDSIGSEYLPDFDENAPSNMVAIEGQVSRLGCNASNEFQVVWGRADRSPLQPNARQYGSELIIYNTSKADSGRYECTLINQRTDEVQQSVYTSLQVMAAPRITLRPPSQIVHPGQSPTVECVVEGDDIISISWRPVDRLPSSRVEIRDSTLLFRQIEVEDAGKYECFAMNRLANATAIAEVIVNEEADRAPSKSHDNEQFAHVGAAVHLSCNVTQPRLKIRWNKDGRALPRSVTQKTDGSLFIRLAQKTDSGRYVCIIWDGYGRQTSNYINLHIEGVECSPSEFHCYDDSACIHEDLICDGYDNCLDGSDENNCILREKRLLQPHSDPRPTGSRDEAPALVSIVQPRRPFRVREKVEVLCRAVSRNVRVTWERYNTNQYVESRTYGDGSLLLIPNVEQSDADVYRCTGIDNYGRQSSDDFVLEVVPVSDTKSYPINDDETMYTVRLGDTIDLPCTSNLQEPVSIEWRREFSPLPAGVGRNERSLHLDSVTEADAGTYVCRVRNNVARVETRATLRVVGIVPKFNGDGWLVLPTLKDAYMQFEIEVSFKPADPNGIILYNSQKEDGTGHYLALQLVDGVPQFTLKFDAADALVTRGDRPLTLNAWHTIRLRRSGSKVTMDVDNTGPFSAESSIQYQTLDLYAPLYIGNAPQQRPYELETTSGFVGCVSMLILGKEEKNIMADSIERNNVYDCDSCTPNLCLNSGVCQEARNERGYICLCPGGFAGQNCDKTGDACRPGLCGPGKCTDTADGYRCACPVTYAGRNCDVRHNIEYPAFTGSAFLAIKPPQTSRYLKMSMKIKPKPPVTDGIIMYCAQSPRGYGGFTSLTVRDGHLEFRYDLGDNTDPVVLTSNKTLQANSWTSVQIIRSGDLVSLTVDMIHSYNHKLSSPRYLSLETPLFVGGVDDSVVLNNNTGVIGGFSGCIKDVKLQGDELNLINSSIQSANVQECVNYDRGDIPDVESICSQCRNGGYCLNADSTYCTCPSGFSGQYCEYRVPLSSQRQPLNNPCAAMPCQNGGTCKSDFSARMNYTCDCPLGYAGQGCQMRLELLQSVGFNGNGYLELPASYLRYDQLELEPAVIALAIHTTNDGVLLYQREANLRSGGDYILIKVNRGLVEMEWDTGSGLNSIVIDGETVTDGESHNVIAKFYDVNRVELTVDGVSKSKETNGISNVMNADSNIYIGGIPESWSAEYDYYQGLTGCIEQVEFTGSTRGLRLGKVAVAGRNTQRCRDQAVHY